MWQTQPKNIAIGHNGLWEIVKNPRFMCSHYMYTFIFLVGQKFRYGKTFGHSTENALKHKLGI